MGPGIFIEPDKSLEAVADPCAALNVHISSGYKAMRGLPFKGENKIFDQICEAVATLDFNYEDQCSARYYFDLVGTLRNFCGEFNRLVEVGVYLGGSSTVFAGCMERFDYDLDLVDLSASYLRASYERVRRLFPEAAKRIRLFHGDLPSYVNNVLMVEDPGKCVVHHDGAHDFTQVVKDLSALYFVQEKIHAIIAQDTHLRGMPKYMNFVDLALQAVFGGDMKYAPIGSAYPFSAGLSTPNPYQGNYFMPDAPEGMVIPLAMNEFKYPHPVMKLEQFL